MWQNVLEKVIALESHYMYKNIKMENGLSNAYVGLTTPKQKEYF